MQNFNTQDLQTKKVGIVIPIYNVAPYLRECLDSVINQTYKNLSIVLVNDGSTDNNESLNIAKEYVAKDSRFILIDKENGGQSTARNVGIAWFNGKHETRLDSVVDLEASMTNTAISLMQDKSNLESNNYHLQRDTTTKLYVCNITNDNPYKINRIYANNIQETNALKSQQIAYIIFLDSDDYWQPCCIEECIKHSNGVDTVWFDWEYYYDGVNKKMNKTQLQLLDFKEGRITPQVLLNALLEKNLPYFAWVVLGIIDFKFLQKINLCFYDGVYAEDHLFGALLFLQSKSIYVIPQPFYSYRIRSNSSCDFDPNHIYIPHHFEKYCDMFGDRKATREYYQASSWFLMFMALHDFLEKNPQHKCKEVEQCIFRLYIKNSLRIIDCKNDPMQLIPRMSILKPYITRQYKYRYRIGIDNLKLYRFLKPLFFCSDIVREIERGLKKLYRKIFKSSQKVF